jgi:hypothetical protein
MRNLGMVIVRAALPLLAAACGDASADGDSAVVTDSAGVRIVQSDRPAWKDGEGWTVGNAPSVDIGVVDGDAAYQLDAVTGSARLSDGRIVVADGGSHQLRFFSAQGRHLATAGRKGGGPGEFQQLSWMGVAPEDTVLAWDAEARRLSMFTPDGRFARAVTPTGLNPLFPSVEALMGDGSLVMTPGFDPATMGMRPEGEFRDTVVWLRVPPGGPARELSRRPGTDAFMSKSGGMMITDEVVFGRRLVLAGAGDGYYTGYTDRYEIEHRDPAGRLRRLVRRSHEPVRATEADLNAYFAADAKKEIRGLPAEMRAAFEEMARTRRERIPHRDNFPAFAGLATDTEGNLWVEQYGRPGDEQPRWDVFDGEGRWLGTVETPVGLRVHRIGPDWILGVEKDEMEVEHVRMYPLVKSAR